MHILQENSASQIWPPNPLCLSFLPEVCHIDHLHRRCCEWAQLWKKPQQVIGFLSLSSNRQINFGNRLPLSPSEPLFSLVTQRVLFQVGKRAVAWRDQTTVVKETGTDLDWSMNSLLAAVNRDVTICSTYIQYLNIYLFKMFSMYLKWMVIRVTNMAIFDEWIDKIIMFRNISNIFQTW